MAKLIFDKDNQVSDGLTPVIDRNFATKGGLADAVGVDEIRYDRPAASYAYTPRTKVTSDNQRVIGGGDVFVVGNSTGNSVQIVEGDGSGGVTILQTLSRANAAGTAGSTADLRGTLSNINAALGIANGTVLGGKTFSTLAAENNHIVVQPDAASECNGILRILSVYCRHNGENWLFAGVISFYSLDKGETWNLEYVSEERNLGKLRLREWSMNNKPTAIYARGDLRDANMLVWAEADYTAKTGTLPDTGAFFVTIWAKVEGSWAHQGMVELVGPGNGVDIDHNHVARVVECIDPDNSDRKGLQVILSEGDGASKNQTTRWTYFAAGDIDPDDPDTLGDFDDDANWDFDSTWNGGVGAIGGNLGTFNDQFIFTLTNNVEGECITGFDIGSSPLHIFAPGDANATGPVKRERIKIDGNGPVETVFYGGQDAEGRRMVVRSWDNEDLSDFSQRAVRILYSDDWGASWSCIGRLTTANNNIIISNGYIYFNNGNASTGGENGIYSMPIPTKKLAVRPAMVSPGGTQRFYAHGGDDPDGGQPDIDWLNLLSSGANWGNGVHPDSELAIDSEDPLFGVTKTQIITREVGGANDGLFLDPDTGEAYPEPPAMTDHLLLVDVPEGVVMSGTAPICRIELSRRYNNGEIDNDPADTLGWVLDQTPKAMSKVVARIGTDLSTGGNPILGSPKRSAIDVSDKTQWQPIYSGAEVIRTGGGAHIAIDLRQGEPANPQRFLFAPSFCVIASGAPSGRVNIPLPLNDGSDATYDDEAITVGSVGFADGVSFRTVCRTPWSAWCAFSDDGTVLDKTIWRLYEDPDNWIVAEWNASIGGVRIRVKADGGTVETLDLANDTTPLRVNRDQTIDLIIARNGDDLVAAVNMDGERYSGTLTDGLASMATLDDWKAGADEDDVITAWNFMALETGTAQTEAELETALEEMVSGGGEAGAEPTVTRRRRRLTGGSAATFRVRIT